MFNPVYTITDQITSHISQIAEIKSLVDRSILLPKREIFLRRAAIIKMAHSSTSIEGNRLQEYQVKELVEDKPVHAEENQILEVKNYLKALNLIDTLSTSKNNFSISDLLSVHKLVTNNLVDNSKSGNFRVGPVYVVNILKNQKEKIVYKPPSYLHVPEYLQELLDWLQSDNSVHPIIRAGVFHYQFESIHPFTDGNGRTGRLLTLLHLYQSGWDFKKVLVLEDYYNRNRKDYYKSLQTGPDFISRKKVDLTNWLNYFVSGFLEEAIRIKNQLLNVDVAGKTENGFDFLNLDELKIVDFALSLGRITSSDVEDILNVPKRTAQFKINRLENMNILTKKNLGPKTYYIITPV